jgi:hypothetical protein
MKVLNNDPYISSFRKYNIGFKEIWLFFNTIFILLSLLEAIFESKQYGSFIMWSIIGVFSYLYCRFMHKTDEKKRKQEELGLWASFKLLSILSIVIIFHHCSKAEIFTTFYIMVALWAPLIEFVLSSRLIQNTLLGVRFTIVVFFIAYWNLFLTNA